MRRLRYVLATPHTLDSPSPLYSFWLCLSVVTAIGYALLALHQAYAHPYTVQDDARQFVFWMQRWVDPHAFPNDLIADYFQSVSPLGYKGVYRIGMAVGITPLMLNRWLPLGLGIISTLYLFRLTLAIVPVPFAAWVASVLFNQTLWMKDDLVSATPRAFVYPFFLAFLWYWTRLHASAPASSRLMAMGSRSPVLGRSLLACGLSLGLLGLFYPQYVLVAGMLVAVSLIQQLIFSTFSSSPKTVFWSGFRPGSMTRTTAQIMLLGLSGMILLPYAMAHSVYGPVITPAQASQMPEFWPGGRSAFFSPNLWWFYGVGDRSGFFHVGLVRPATLAIGLFLPLLLRFGRSPLRNAITVHVHLLTQLLIAATVTFGAAHLFLFRLHLPSRYTDHSLRIIFAIAAALVVILILDMLLQRCMVLKRPSLQRAFYQGRLQQGAPLRVRLRLQSLMQTGMNLSAFSQALYLPQPLRQRLRRHLPSPWPGLAILWAGLIVVLLVFYPLWVSPFPLTKYKVGKTPAIYTYLQGQPLDTVVASIERDADNIPTFAQRTLLLGYEYAIPYHMGYYRSMQQRAIALIQALYTTRPAELASFITTYHISFWALSPETYRPGYLDKHWVRQYLNRPEADAMLSPSPTQRPLLQRFQNSCAVVEDGPLILIDTQCVLTHLQADGF